MTSFETKKKFVVSNVARKTKVTFPDELIALVACFFTLLPPFTESKGKDTYLEPWIKNDGLVLTLKYDSTHPERGRLFYKNTEVSYLIFGKLNKK